jgi:HlyD family secretion protein
MQGLQRTFHKTSPSPFVEKVQVEISMPSEDTPRQDPPDSGAPGAFQRIIHLLPSVDDLARWGEEASKRFRKLPPPLQLPVGALLILLILGTPFLLGRVTSTAASGASDASGSRMDTREFVVALARLEPGDGILDVSAPGDDRIEEILVEEGEWVSKGQILATGRQYAVRKAEYDLLQTRIMETERRVASEEAFRATVVEQAELDLEAAEQLQYQVAAREADVRTLTADSAAAAEAAQRSARLLSEGLSSEEAASAAQRAAERAAATLAEARALLDDTRTQVALDLRQAQNRLKMARAEAELSRNSIPLESLTKELALAEASLEGALARAPMDAQVLRISVSPGENTRGRPILSLGETQKMYAVAEVYQTDIQLLDVGQRVELTSSALQESLFGVVEDVGMVIQRNDIFGDSPNAPTDARVFRVKIRLNDSELASRYSNLEVEARFFVLDEEDGS